MENQALEQRAEKTREKILGGYVMCATPSCKAVIEKKHARNYGAGDVCEKCYERWFWLQED